MMKLVAVTLAVLLVNSPFAVGEGEYHREEIPAAVTSKAGSAYTNVACKFPFTYGGYTFHTCTQYVYGTEGRFWCSLTSEFDGRYAYCYLKPSVPASGWKYLSLPAEVTTMAYISSGGLGTWATDADYQIFLLDYQNNQWLKAEGALKQISVGGEQVWGVTAEGRVYYDTTMSLEPDWTLASSETTLLMQVSVSQMNHVWGVNNEHQAVYYQGERHWEIVSGVSLMQISAGSSGVWGVTTGHKVYYRQGTYGNEASVGSEWLYVSTPSSFSEVLSGAGFVIGLDVHGHLYKRVTTTEEPAGTKWFLLNGRFQFKTIDAGIEFLWGITTGGKLVQESPDTILPAYLPQVTLPANGWIYISMPSGVTTMICIASGGLGTWAVDADNNIFYLGAQNQWVQTGGALMQISVGGKQVWGVNSNHQIWYGTSMSTNPEWHLVNFVEGALMKQVSVSELGHVWGVSTKNLIYYYAGGEEHPWVNVEGQLAQISVGVSGVWGVSGNHKAFYRVGTYGDEANVGTAWQYVAAPVQFKEVSSGIDFVLALDIDGQIYIRYTTAENPTGSEWALVNTLFPLSTIDAGTKYAVGASMNGKLVLGNMTAIVAFQNTLPHVTVPAVGWAYLSMPSGVTMMVDIANGGLGTWAVDADYQVYYLGANSEWVKTNGALKQISVGANQVWGVDSDYETFFTTSMSANAEWQTVTGVSLKQVSVSAFNHVWGVSTGDYAYHYQGENHWEYVAGQWIIYISVGQSGVWGVNYYSQVYYRQETYGDVAGVGTEWLHVETPTTFKQVSSGPGYVIGLTTSGQLYRTLTSAEHPTGTGWVLLNQQQQFKSIQAGLQYIWAVETTGKLIVESPTTVVKATLAVNGWTGVGMPTGVTTVKSIANGGLGTWAVDADDQIFYVGANNEWVKTNGALMQISVGGKQVWGVNSKSQAWYGTSMSTVPGWKLATGATLTQVSVSQNDHVWGVSSNDDEYLNYYYGGNSWQLVAGSSMKQISVGGAGVWGVSSSNYLYYKKGTYGDQNWVGIGCDWIYVGAYYKEVSSGPGYIIALNTEGKLYKRVTSAVEPAGTEWTLLNHLHTFKTIDAGVKYLWGVETNGNLIQESATKIVVGLGGDE